MKPFGFLTFHTASLVFWFVVLFHDGSIRDNVSLTTAAITTTSWSAWGRWSSCNPLDGGRRSRSRNCVSPRGITQSASNCVGPARRTRQCESCAYPVLNRARKPDSRSASGGAASWHISSPSFRQTNSKTAWCSSSQQFSSGQEYLEIAFETALKLTGIGTRGHKDNSAALSGFVTEYKLMYSFDGARWFAYTDEYGDVLFKGNIDTVRLRRNNLKSAFVIRYLRVYLTKYHSRSCIDLELYGCVYNCGGLITENPMSVSAPNAAQFTEEPDCLWRVDSKVATKLLLMFPYFKLLCRDGFLGVRDGSSPFLEAELLEEFCGQSQRPSPLAIEGNDIWLHYKTNATTDDIGFRLHVNTIVMETRNASEGVVKLPKTAQGYAQWYRYIWYIITPQNGTIEFTIHDFTSEHKRRVNGKCIGDMVVLSHGNKPGSRVVRYCGDAFPKVIECKSGFLRVKFRAKSDHPKWRLHFSFKMQGSELGTEVSPTNRSTRGNGTLPALDVLEKTLSDDSNESASKTPVIVASILSGVIALVFLVALIHFLRKRKAFLKKHPYDCNSTRPMSHFGDEDSTPFINTNVLMWSDSNSHNYEKLEKPKNGKNSLPFVTVTLREDGPQRLSFISPDMVSGKSEPSLEADADEAPESLIVSDTFTEECMELLNNNLAFPFPDTVSESSDLQRDTDSQHEGSGLETSGEIPEREETSPEDTETSPEDNETSPEDNETSPEDNETSPEDNETSPEDDETSPELINSPEVINLPETDDDLSEVSE